MKLLNKILPLTALTAAIALSSCSAIASSGDTYLPEAKNDTIYTIIGLEDELRVSFIDVGQGDSEFIELPDGETILIDAGTNETGKNVVEYIKSLGHTSIDYVIGTHPHEDHIGGLDDVINAFDIGNVYMPKVTADTQTFEDVLDAVEAKGLTINTAKAGVTIVDADNLCVKMLAPTLESYENTNDYSAVIKVVYDDTSFLFTGDAEEYSENLITDNVKADVLKVGHHGSSTSTSSEFLEKVSPSSAVISCGKDNSYGHPHTETIEKLNANSITTYRTDELGTITAISDGKTITFEASNICTLPSVPGTNTPDSTDASKDTANSSNSIIYVLNKNSRKIHLPECSSADQISDENKGYTDDYAQAISDGYTPCKICNP